MSSEKFCLRWNDFESNISVAFKELREDKDFFDVTLACEDEQIHAHKLILAACSPFFRNVLRRNAHQHPLLYLKGVKYSDIQAILGFMYHGEVNVAQEDLNSFLAVAEDLKVKGLTQGAPSSSSKNKTDYKVSQKTPLTSEVRTSSVLQLNKERPSDISIDDDIQEVTQVPVKTEPIDQTQLISTTQPKYYVQQNKPIAAPTQTYQKAATPEQTDTYSTEVANYSTETEMYDESYDDYGQYTDDYNGQDQVAGAKGFGLAPDELESFISINCVKDESTNRWVCSLCGQSGGKLDVSRHIEAKHASLPNLKCSICGKLSKTRDSLRRHVTKYHKDQLALSI